MLKINREKQIVRTSLVGVATNILLAGFKAILGVFSGSIAIVLDAVNNLTDVVSSLATIVGMKLASKPADREHPFGHGRTEYFTTILVAMIIAYTGAAAMYESAQKIMMPGKIEYLSVTYIFMVAAIIIKILLGLFYQKRGKLYNSSTLIGSGVDAMSDAIITGSTLLAAIFYNITKINIDGWLGIFISLIVIRSGIKMIKGAISEMLGRRTNSELANNLKSTILKYKNILGVYDLFLDNFGPENYTGYVHVEVPDTMTAKEISDLTHEIDTDVFHKFGIALTIGIYAINLNDSESENVKKKVEIIIKEHPEILQMHGFYIDQTAKNITFDIVLDFCVKDRKAYRTDIIKHIEDLLPGYKVNVQLDVDTAVTD